MPKKLCTGNPCFRTQFFEKRSVLLARSSTFNISVYAPCHDCVVSQLNELPGKMDRALAEDDSPSLVEEIPSEAMDSTLCKLL